MLTLDFVHTGLPPFLRSLACSGFAMPVLDFLHLGLGLSPHSLTQLDFVLLLLGLSRVGPVSLLLLTDSTCLGPSLLVRGAGCLELAMSVLDFLHLGLSFLLRSCACLGSAVSVFGLTRLGPVFLLPVVDNVHLDLSLSLHGFG